LLFYKRQLEDPRIRIVHFVDERVEHWSNSVAAAA
jgi:hypothetical protein